MLVSIVNSQQYTISILGLTASDVFLETNYDSIEFNTQSRGLVDAIWPTKNNYKAKFNPDDFSMIVRNLLRNACNYSEQNEKITINLLFDNSEVILSVLDKGRGISMSDQERIFERFYRVDKGRSRALGGTGIGLSLVKHAVERNNGDIQLESKLGEGSEFVVKFFKT